MLLIGGLGKWSWSKFKNGRKLASKIKAVSGAHLAIKVRGFSKRGWSDVVKEASESGSEVISTVAGCQVKEELCSFWWEQRWNSKK